MEWATDVVNGLAAIVVVAAEAACQVAVERRWELAWLPAGAVSWTVTGPLRSIGSRIAAAFIDFALKWSVLAKLCVMRYCRYVRGPAVQMQPLRTRVWKGYETLLATPLVVLESKGEHEDGLGRLLYKWLDALHEWWCVFLPETWASGRKACSKYCTGASLESGRSVARAKLVAKVVWTLTSLILFSAFYAARFTYEVVEWICQGVAGLFAVVVVFDCWFASEEGEHALVTNYWLLVVNVWVALVCITSKLWRLYEASAGERSPLTMATEGYAAWCAALEEQEQAERLSEAFWRMDGGGNAPRVQVRTRSGLQAERRAWQVRREVDQAACARRGRRDAVGEDVPSRNGSDRSNSAWATMRA
ncbi:hypothetical protein PHYSODRAFT_511251 [Phytophthora sojae]|uniref:Uncharacterized protein n=1 Tax=Phytophthora sojae (strain P6497) TaxID=1094619 RepID=G4ZUS8_PHYSP|nr:hypothetical protein PHYSODRAFT_511251 [Phytophthora sojae]EGZ13552.1 hypothetical protein PHYSODRAFT_511251 [Phytophthora sojae]|eukprot:XP_009530981.1 hypothetical protein PHYSODRAFT_511251 [Phytophthora sojae]